MEILTWAAFADDQAGGECGQPRLRNAARPIAVRTRVPRERVGCDMNPYRILGSGIGTDEAAALGARLASWHDAIVAHERRLRAGTTSDRCEDECPHAEAPVLWSQAVDTFGTRAHELTFLRSRAQRTRRAVNGATSTHTGPEETQHERRRPPGPHALTTTTSPGAIVAAGTECEP